MYFVVRFSFPWPTELAAKLGPEYVALASGLEEMDPNSKDSKEINSTLDGLDNLCPN